MKTNHNSDKMQILSPVNCSNPFDLVGQQHNATMDYCLQNIPSKSKRPSMEVFLKLSEDFILAYCLEEVPDANERKVKKLLDHVSKTFPDKLENLDKEIQKSKISDIAYNELQWLLNLIQEYPKKEFPLLFFKRRIFDWENGIDELDVSDKDRDMLWVAASVARYSSYYNIKKLIMEDGPSTTSATKAKGCKNKPKCQRTGDVVAKDVEGAAFGAIVGAATPLGPIGALFGGLIGGAAASANKHYNG